MVEHTESVCVCVCGARLSLVCFDNWSHEIATALPVTFSCTMRAWSPPHDTGGLIRTLIPGMWISYMHNVKLISLCRNSDCVRPRQSKSNIIGILLVATFGSNVLWSLA